MNANGQAVRVGPIRLPGTSGKLSEEKCFESFKVIRNDPSNHMPTCCIANIRKNLTAIPFHYDMQKGITIKRVVYIEMVVT